MIEEYHFGLIKIDGKTYNYDVEVRWTPEGVASRPYGASCEVLKWWRKESHFVYLEDVKRAIDQNPELIIIGTGESGLMEVGKDAKKEIKSRGIELIIDVTEEAVKTFNILLEESEDYNPPTTLPAFGRAPEKGQQKRAIGLFHLTC